MHVGEEVLEFERHLSAGSFNVLYAEASAEYRTTHTFWILMCDVGKRLVPHILGV